MQVDTAGYTVGALCRNNFQFIVFNALPASVKRIPSVFFSSKMECTEYPVASPPASCPSTYFEWLPLKNSRRADETALRVMRWSTPRKRTVYRPEFFSSRICLLEMFLNDWIKHFLSKAFLISLIILRSSLSLLHQNCFLVEFIFNLSVHSRRSWSFSCL